MMMTRVTAFLCCVLVSGCANQAGARMGLFSATAPVVAILGDGLYVGYAKGYMDRTGTIDLQSTTNEDVRCVGQFRYTGSKIGSGEVHCSDGRIAEFQFNALSRLSGYGFGRASDGAFSLTYGLSLEESRQYLRPPAGKRLEVNEDKAELVTT